MTRLVRSALLATAGLLALTTSCNVERTIAPKQTRIAKFGGANTNITMPSVVISQVYGGGGNSGAVFKNDFIELFNPGATVVSVAGWSVQYASAAGSSWAVTALSGSIPAGGYYLVQEVAGAGGITSLPTPDATGTIAMAAGSGKVFLSSTTAALTTACPTSPTVVDQVSFGAASDCGFGTTGAAISGNVTAAIRNDQGCAYTQVLSADFTYATPNPRNSASLANSCGAPPPPPPVVVSVTVAPASASVSVGATQQFTATALDASSAPISGVTIVWSSTVNATVDANGLATGATVGDATVTATAPNSVAGSATLHVDAAPPATVNPGDLVLSQVYGGGGNAGAALKNDFIEIFNRTTSAIDLTGFSVQHTSAAGTTWSVTPLSGTIPGGGYYLVKEAQGAGGTVDLPTPDAVGTIAMGATSGKDLIATTTTAFGIACPSGASVVDIISYGSGTTCGVAAAAPSNTTGELRKHSGCTWTQNAANDLVVVAPAPRNSASPPRSCVAGPLDHVAVSGNLAILAGTTTQLFAEPLDASDNEVTGATVTWSSGDESIATVSATGLVTGVAANTNPVTITATGVAAAITKTGSAAVQVNNAGINWLDVSSSSSSFPPGFQTQVFFTARTTEGGTVVPATFTFEAVDPQFATVQTVANTAIITGVAAPTDGSRPGIRVTATPDDGATPPYVFVSHPVTIEVPGAASPSIYAVNDEFGDPTPASAGNPNDMLIRRDQYVISYNQSRGTPNWVSYELDARQMVPGQDRCNCFTADPLLPADKQIFTSDYTNGGFDRGHMTRSADRTAGNVDNAITFFLTNVVPQQGDLNQGVWAQFENMLADSARAGRAVYIVTGPLYSASHPLTFVKNEGKIAIPDSTWKVALIGAASGGNPFTHGNIQSFDDLVGLTLLAVNMPNISGVRNDPPSKYFTTVDKIEEATGYDLLSLLQSGMQGALDYHDRKPVPQFSFTGSPVEGSALTFDASASTDPDFGRTDLGRTEALTYSWHFSDGSSAAGAVVTKTFAIGGNYTATLTITDAWGWPALSTTTVAVQAHPIAATSGPYSGNEGAAVALSGAPSSDSDGSVVSWTWDFGDGTTGSGQNVMHTYAQDGSYTVSLTVTDNSGLTSSTTTNASIANVAPTVSAFAGDTLFRREPYHPTGTVADPGAETLTATVNYGDGGGAVALALAGGTFALSHQYSASGTFTVTVSVWDDHVTTTRTQTVKVLTRHEAIQSIIAQLKAALQAHSPRSVGLLLRLDAALLQALRGNDAAAASQLMAIQHDIDDLVAAGKLNPQGAALLHDLAARVADAIAN